MEQHSQEVIVCNMTEEISQQSRGMVLTSYVLIIMVIRPSGLVD